MNEITERLEGHAFKKIKDLIFIHIYGYVWKDIEPILDDDGDETGDYLDSISYNGWWDEKEGGGCVPWPVDPTASVDKAMMVVTLYFNDYYFVLNNNQGGNWDCSLERKNHPKGFQRQFFVSNQKTPELAICKVMLEAKGIKYE